MEVIAATTSAVEDASFTTSSRGFWLYGEGFQALHNERAFVKFTPNTVFVDLPAGTYRVAKMATAVAAGVAFEEAA